MGKAAKSDEAVAAGSVGPWEAGGISPFQAAGRPGPGRGRGPTVRGLRGRAGPPAARRSLASAAVDERPIGMFDSGFGGLTVARAIIDLLPAEDLVYVGDTGRYPYGPRSAGRGARLRRADHQATWSASTT